MKLASALYRHIAETSSVVSRLARSVTSRSSQPPPRHALEMLTLEERVLFSAATHLVQQLQAAKQDLQLPQALSKLDKYDLLIVDDIGYVRPTAKESSVLFELIAHRYETGSLIITSNQPFAEWDRIFPDQMMTVAAVDRLVHHATIIEVSSDSYRRKEALGQVAAETPAMTAPAATTTPPSSSARSGEVCPDPTPSG